MCCMWGIGGLEFCWWLVVVVCFWCCGSRCGCCGGCWGRWVGIFWVCNVFCWLLLGWGWIVILGEIVWLFLVLVWVWIFCLLFESFFRMVEWGCFVFWRRVWFELFYWGWVEFWFLLGEIFVFVCWCLGCFWWFLECGVVEVFCVVWFVGVFWCCGIECCCVGYCCVVYCVSYVYVIFIYFYFWWLMCDDGCVGVGWR